jgi:hypothetical protein
MNTDRIYQAVKRDHELEVASENSTLTLARHRWHWTWDESNPDAVNVTEYARRIGRSQKVVWTMVSGYNEYSRRGIEVSEGKQLSPMSINEAIARAATTAEQTELYEATAKAAGTTFQNVVKNNTQLARAVKETAEHLAELNGTDVAEELTRAAESTVASIKAGKRAKAERMESKSSRTLAVEGHLLHARKYLQWALRDSYGELGELDVEYIRLVTTRLGELIRDMDLVLDGGKVEWDADAEWQSMTADS